MIATPERLKRLWKEEKNRMAGVIEADKRKADSRLLGKG